MRIRFCGVMRSRVPGTVRGTKPGRGKFLLDGEAERQKEIGYRTRLVGGSRFCFYIGISWNLCRERPMCRSAGGAVYEKTGAAGFGRAVAVCDVGIFCRFWRDDLFCEKMGGPS